MPSPPEHPPPLHSTSHSNSLFTSRVEPRTRHLIQMSDAVMATLEALKHALRKDAESTCLPKQPLTEAQYSAGFDIFTKGKSSAVYQDFIAPQLSTLLNPFLESNTRISVLEIGPGPVSVLGSLPSHVRRSIKAYAAMEPNELFRDKLKNWLCPPSHQKSPLPCLDQMPEIRPVPFPACCGAEATAGTQTGDDAPKFHVILFCHSMYGMSDKGAVIKKALSMLVQQPEDAMIIVFHRDGALCVEGLACHSTATFPTGVACVPDDNEALEQFASFIAGYALRNTDNGNSVRTHWRQTCRALGRRDENHKGYLVFDAPEVMVAFTRHSLMLPELTAHVPLGNGDRVKNRQARSHTAASVVRPTNIGQVQYCVRWALKHHVGLTVVGGSHSDHCVWSNVVAVDMSAFSQVHILAGEERTGPSTSGMRPLVVAEAGCRSTDIIRKALAEGLTLPLGSRPSVGAGLWLQGGIGHLSRLHGLTCDTIIGAVIVSVVSGEVLYVGHVPNQYRPADAVRPEDEEGLLWALRGAGTNFGVVVSVTFNAYPAPTYKVRDWVFPLIDENEAQRNLGTFNEHLAKALPPRSSLDAYLYWDRGQLHLGLTMFEASMRNVISDAIDHAVRVLGPESSAKVANCVELFEAEMYISGMHGGHGGGKTSSFKRCLFLKDVGAPLVDIMIKAIKTRPYPLCYIHLLHAGGAAADIEEATSAFGCRGWEFACVVTGVWPRNEDGTGISRGVVRWVYSVAQDLLPLSSGAYGADLGPDPRDAALAAKAFGPNLPRLAILKRRYDRGNVLSYACPLPAARVEHKLTVLVTGRSCAGKDYCAEVWAAIMNTSARVVSISKAIKLEYAAASGAEGKRLLEDRPYKEQHREALTKFFKEQVQQEPRLPQKQFINLVKDNEDVDVLFITGMRDNAPASAFSPLVPRSKVLEVRVKACNKTRHMRKGERHGTAGSEDDEDDDGIPDLTFLNNVDGPEAAAKFAKQHLSRWTHPDLQHLANMVRRVPDFPWPGSEFRHVLEISQKPGGLSLCTSLLRTQFPCDWGKVTAVACCEFGGWIYAAPLATSLGIPLALIREAGKLPEPTISVTKPTSHISSAVGGEKRIEMAKDIVMGGTSVVVVDDVLATGNTLCAVLQLLGEAGVNAEDVNVLVVAEFPIHRGRELLRRRGFGRAKVHSLLVFGEA